MPQPPRMAILPSLFTKSLKERHQPISEDERWPSPAYGCLWQASVSTSMFGCQAPPQDAAAASQPAPGAWWRSKAPNSTTRNAVPAPKPSFSSMAASPTLPFGTMSGLTFCKRFHIIRYDRRGYGRSPAATSWYTETEDLAALLHSRKVRHAILVGSSHGGELSIDFTLQYPHLVRQLVLVGAVVSGFPYTDHFLNRGIRNSQPFEKGDVASGLSNWAKDKYLLASGHDGAQETPPRSPHRKSAGHGTRRFRASNPIRAAAPERDPRSCPHSCRRRGYP